MPPGPRYAMAGAGGSAWYLLSRGQRRNALANYGAVLGLPPGDARVRRVARAAFAGYGETLADFVLIGSLGPEELAGRVTVDGRDNLDAGLAAGRGVILAVPHMASWDMGGSYAGVLGYRVSAVAERFPGSLDEAVVRTREALGMRVIPLGRSAVRAVTAALESNGVVCLLCDLPHGPGVEVEMFGRRATVPSGPAAFALRTGAALLPSTVVRDAPGRYRAVIEPALDLAGCGPRDAAAVMQRVVRRFESFIRERPEQWYAFRPLLAEAT